MRKIIIYIAISLDGKIADSEGGVAWLDQVPNPENSDYGYSDFIKNIDTTIMGNNTYKQVLGFDVEFPYKAYKNYVVSHDTSLKDDENVTYLTENIPDQIREMKMTEGKDIWCIGGGKLNSLLLDNNLIDELLVFVMPTVLGQGLDFAPTLSSIKSLELIKCISHSSGVVELHYGV